MDGDKATVWGMDEGAKEKAIKDGKVKGGVDRIQVGIQVHRHHQNLARFVARRVMACGTRRSHCGLSGWMPSSETVTRAGRSAATAHRMERCSWPTTRIHRSGPGLTIPIPGLCNGTVSFQSLPGRVGPVGAVDYVGRGGDSTRVPVSGTYTTSIRPACQRSPRPFSSA